MTPPAPIRVLVVEDSSTVRKVVSDALNSDSEITVVGTAANGRIGLEELKNLEPDLITLDIEMPEMDGLTMLSELRKSHPRLPVIMVSTLTGRGASATLDALSRGASDYVTKPTSATATTSTSAIEHFRRELIPRVKALCPRRSQNAPTRSMPGSLSIPPRVGVSTFARPAAVAPSAVARPPRAPSATPKLGRYELLAIGCSTGGPNALEVVLAKLAADFSAPILVTQHMPPMFTKMLADRLNEKCAIAVVEAQDGMELEAGTAYLAPGDFHIVIHRSAAGFALSTNQAPPENSCRPAVDVMFRSISQVCGSRTLAVVMTGMGYDGRIGAQAIAAAGGEIIAQDQETSVVWGMPGAVAEAGVASEILPLGQIAAAIERRFARNPQPLSSHGATARPLTSAAAPSRSSSIGVASGPGAPLPNRAPAPVPNRAPAPVPNRAPAPLPSRAPAPLPGRAGAPQPTRTPTPQPSRTTAPHPTRTPAPGRAAFATAQRPTDRPGQSTQPADRLRDASIAASATRRLAQSATRPAPTTQGDVR